MSLILGIETSCDETAGAVVEDGLWVRSNVIASQHELHERFAGVVPEVASRAHLERLGPVLQEALRIATTPIDRIDAVAIGHRPGLIGSLMIGLGGAKTIAWSLGKPLIGINHIHAHLYAASLKSEEQVRQSKDSIDDGKKANDAKCEPQNKQLPVANLSSLFTLRSSVTYPALGLVVSGGHSNLYELKSPTDLTLLGRTIDDAVGEAFDKAAVILKLGYPGGPALDKLAQSGNPDAHQLPRSLLAKESLDFSFSGLKTALLYTVRGKPRVRGKRASFERSADDLSDSQRADLAASFQAAAIETLILKIKRAWDMLLAAGRQPRCLIIGGGVSANSLLRQRAMELGEHRSIEVHLPAFDYCLDNAAMIAGLAHHHFIEGRFDNLELPAVATSE